MAFVPQYEVSRYTFKNQGSLSGSERIFSAKEIRELGEKHNAVVDALQEIQLFLKATFP